MPNPPTPPGSTGCEIAFRLASPVPVLGFRWSCTIPWESPPPVAKPGWSRSRLWDDALAQITMLSAQKAPAGRLSVIPKAKYMTLGPKFYTKLVLAITRRRMNEIHRFLGESSHNFT